MDVQNSQMASEAVNDCRVPYFDVLKDRLDISRVPFTERGSRILVSLGRDGGLDLKMAERWVHLEKKLGNHRIRRPLIESINPIDGSGNRIAFDLTTWPHKLLMQTDVGDFEVFFADGETLYISLPSAACGLSFSVMAQHFEPDEFGGVFENPRLFAMTFDDPSISLNAVGENDGTISFELHSRGEATNTVAINIPGTNACFRGVGPADVIRNRVENTWIKWFDAVPKVDREYWREYYFAWSVLRTGLLSPAGYLKREAMAPSKTHYLGVWHWDAYFHALAYRHVDTQLAQDQLWAMLDHQLDSGLIPDVVHDEGLIVGEAPPDGREITKPPLMAWAALRLYEAGSGSAFLSDVYERLVRWNNWWLDWCDDDNDGIVQYNHPFSSGLDDSPLWDAGMPVEAPDLNTYLCVHMQSLATIARIIGRYDDAESWDRKAKDLARSISAHFYDDSAGIFWAMKNHAPIRVATPFNVLPIWSGHLPPHQVRAAVANLTNKATFWTEFGIPTVSRADSSYDPNKMWRGPIWVNVNYMLVEALSRVGYCSLAAALANRTIDLIARNGIAEYFNSLTGNVPDRAAPTFGWSAALFVDLLIRRQRESSFWPKSGSYVCDFAAPFRVSS